MLRRILFFFCFFFVLIPSSFSEDAEEEKQPDKWPRRLETFKEELIDQIWPELWLEYQLTYYNLEHHGYFHDLERIDDLNEDGYSAFFDAIKEVGEEELGDWKWWKELREWFKKRADVKLAIYQQELAEKGDSRLTIDAGWEVDEGGHHLLDAGLRIRSHPALYLQYHWLNNGSNGSLEHDLSWYPIDWEFEYRLDDMPFNLDVAFNYNYKDRVLKGRFEDLRITKDLNFRLSTSYGFEDNELSILGIFYATF